MRRLALDHITAVDASPVQLIELAQATGCYAVCLFLASMPVLPRMPRFDCIGEAGQRKAVKQALADNAVGIDLAYPFTLTGRSDMPSFVPALECASDLGANIVNILHYDRDPLRRIDNFGRFCDLARSFGLKVAVEFYPPSQIGTLPAALDPVGQIGRPGTVGINADLLHLMRSGGTLADLAAAPHRTILYGQIADGPIESPVDRHHEASAQRMLAGSGRFDIAGFVRALPPDCPISVEIPRDPATPGRAVTSVRAAIG
jgi:sugar phosphate isomerase/epimerase